MAAQQQVSRDQQTVQGAEAALAQILATPSSADSNSGSSSSRGTNGTSSTGTNGNGSSSANRSQSTGTKGSTSSAGSSTTPSTEATNSAAQLASDQSNIDSDQAAVITAQESLNNATLTASMAGTVAAVNLSVGESVTSGSTSDTITITDPGSYETTSSLSSSQVSEVAVGDPVTVSIDGQPGTYAGRVTSVGPAQGSSSSYTYPLVVALAAGSLSQTTTVSGSTAQVAVAIAEASHTTVVPTSAVHTTTTGSSYVTTLQSGREVRTPVKLGVVGDVYTQITSGVSPGTQVVLADDSQPVPSSSTNSANSIRGFGGEGFPTGNSGVPAIAAKGAS